MEPYQPIREPPKEPPMQLQIPVYVTTLGNQQQANQSRPLPSTDTSHYPYLVSRNMGGDGPDGFYR